jgi:hypothetical protein
MRLTGPASTSRHGIIAAVQATQPPEYGSIVGRPTWPELLSSDFYNWFNLSELGRARDRSGWDRVELKPGGFQQFIEILFLVDQDAVVGASLGLDRSWLDGDRVALANGGDLAKSLLAWLGTADGALPEVSRQLEAAVMAAAGTLVRGPREHVEPDPQVAPLVETSLGRPPGPAAGEAVFLGQRLLRASDAVRANGYWLQLDWGDCAIGPGELPRWSCDVCGVALVERQVGESPVSGGLRHWVWVPGGRVGHPVTVLV